MFPILGKYLLRGFPPPDKSETKTVTFLHRTQLIHVTLDPDDSCEK